MTYLVEGKCKATIYKRDQYRVHRGHGFRMHYTADQCSRNAKYSGYCYQHKHLGAAK